MEPILSIQKAAALLRCFTEQHPEWGVMELARQLNMHKSTVSRMLATLQIEGLVDQHPQSGRYRLGLGLISLAGVALGRIDIRGIAHPHLTRLLHDVQETITIRVLDGREAVNVERLSSPQALRYVGWIGRRTPLHCTAGGRVLVAGQAPQQWNKLLPTPLTSFTKHTITNEAALVSLLEKTNRDGYSIVIDEFEEGISSVAAPVRNHLGQVAAAITIAGPTSRLTMGTLQTFLPPLFEATHAISAEMGFRSPNPSFLETKQTAQ